MRRLLFLLLLSSITLISVAGCGEIVISGGSQQIVKVKTSMSGLAIGTFWDGLNEIKRYEGDVDNFIKEGKIRFALYRATSDYEEYETMRMHYLHVVKYGPKWGDEYAREVEEVRKAGQPYVANYDAKRKYLAQVQRDLYAKLSDRDLAYAYQEFKRVTVPSELVEVDILNELKIRERAAKALWERSQNPRMDNDIKAFGEYSTEDVVMIDKVNRCVAYEYLTAETDWLVRFIPEDQKKEGQDIVDGIHQRTDKIKAILEKLKTVTLGGNNQLKAFIDHDNRTMNSKMVFPRELLVKNAGPKGETIRVTLPIKTSEQTNKPGETAKVHPDKAAEHKEGTPAEKGSGGEKIVPPLPPVIDKKDQKMDPNDTPKRVDEANPK
jgi:hypothetical protein